MKKILFATLFFYLTVSYSQIRFYPYLIGLNIHKDKIEKKENQFVGYDSRSFEKNSLKPIPYYSTYVGFDLLKEFKKDFIQFSYLRRDVTIGIQEFAMDSLNPEAKPYVDYFPRFGSTKSEGTLVRNFSISYGRKFDLHIFSRSNPAILANTIILSDHWLNFRLEPSIGVGFDKMVPTNWDPAGICEGFNDTIALNPNELSLGSSTTGFDTYDCDDPYKVEVNRWGMTLNLGFKFIFLNRFLKERLALDFKYIFSPTTFLRADYYGTIDKNKGKYLATVSTKGNALLMTMSYSFTLINKKGERFRDRYTKN